MFSLKYSSFFIPFHHILEKYCSPGDLKCNIHFPMRKNLVIPSNIPIMHIPHYAIPPQQGAQDA